MGEGTGQDPGGGSLKDRGAPASTSGGAAVGRWLLLTGRRLQWGGAERQGPRPELRSACVCPGGTRCPRGVGVGAASGHRGAPLGGPDPPGQQVADAQDPATAGGRGGSLALSAARGPVAPHRALGLGLARGKVPGSHPEDEGPVHRGHVRTTVSTPDPMAHWQTLLGPLPGGGLVPQPETPTSPPAPSSAALCPEARTPASPRVPAAPVYPCHRGSRTRVTSLRAQTQGQGQTLPRPWLPAPASPLLSLHLVPGILSVSLENADLTPCPVTSHRGPHSGSPTPAPRAACLGLRPASRVPCPRPLPGALQSPGPCSHSGPPGRGGQDLSGKVLSNTRPIPTPGLFHLTMGTGGLLRGLSLNVTADGKRPWQVAPERGGWGGGSAPWTAGPPGSAGEADTVTWLPGKLLNAFQGEGPAMNKSWQGRESGSKLPVPVTGKTRVPATRRTGINDEKGRKGQVTGKKPTAGDAPGRRARARTPSAGAEENAQGSPRDAPRSRLRVHGPLQGARGSQPAFGGSSEPSPSGRRGCFPREVAGRTVLGPSDAPAPSPAVRGAGNPGRARGGQPPPPRPPNAPSASCHKELTSVAGKRRAPCSLAHQPPPGGRPTARRINLATSLWSPRAVIKTSNT